MSVAAAVAHARELESLLGAANVISDSASLTMYAVDGNVPGIAVLPADEQQVAAVLRYASEHKLNVVPAGGFTAQHTGRLMDAVDIVLLTTRLDALRYEDPGDLTIGVGAGVTLAKLDSVLAPHQQWLPLDAAQPDRKTIGGALATAAHGPLKHFYGGVRDFCIGVRFVTGDGVVAKGGGHVVKNVAGYDLMKLLIGSHGSLAVITGANFKLFPRPRQTRTWATQFATAADAIRFRDALLHSPLAPLCFELVSSYAAPYVGLGNGDAWRVLIRAAGSDAVLVRYSRDLTAAGAVESPNEIVWRALSDFALHVFERHPETLFFHIGAAIQDLATVLASAERIAAEHAFFPAIVGRFALGSLAVAFVPVLEDPPTATQYAEAVSAFRALLPQSTSAIVARAPHDARRAFDPWGTPTSDLAAMTAVKHALDPHHVLSRGRGIV